KSEYRAQPISGRAAQVRDDPVELGVEVAAASVHHLREDLRLRGEAGEDGPDGDPGAARNRPHGGLLVALGLEELERGVEDATPGRLLLRAAPAVFRLRLSHALASVRIS